MTYPSALDGWEYGTWRDCPARRHPASNRRFFWRDGFWQQLGLGYDTEFVPLVNQLGFTYGIWRGMLARNWNDSALMEYWAKGAWQWLAIENRREFNACEVIPESEFVENYV